MIDIESQNQKGATRIFRGFDEEWFKNSFFKYPKPLADGFWGQLSPVESAVLNYVLRRTIGFRKYEDYISYRQFTKGVKKWNGTILDYGSGVSSVNTVKKAQESLEQKGFIRITRGKKGTINKISLVFVNNQNLTQRREMLDQKINSSVLKPTNSVSPIDNTIDDTNRKEQKRFFDEILKLLKEGLNYTGNETSVHLLMIFMKFAGVSQGETLELLKQFRDVADEEVLKSIDIIEKFKEWAKSTNYGKTITENKTPN